MMRMRSPDSADTTNSTRSWRERPKSTNAPKSVHAVTSRNATSPSINLGVRVVASPPALRDAGSHQSREMTDQIVERRHGGAPVDWAALYLWMSARMRRE